MPMMASAKMTMGRMKPRRRRFMSWSPFLAPDLGPGPGHDAGSPLLSQGLVVVDHRAAGIHQRSDDQPPIYIPAAAHRQLVMGSVQREPHAGAAAAHYPVGRVGSTPPHRETGGLTGIDQRTP